MHRIFSFVCLWIVSFLPAFADPFVFSDEDQIRHLENHIYLLEDGREVLTIEDVLVHEGFIKNTGAVPNLGISGVYWIKIPVTNKTREENFLLTIPYATIDRATLYTRNKDGKISYQTSGDNLKLSERPFKHQYPIFTISLSPDSSQTFFLKVKSNEQMMLPIYIGKPQAVNEQLMKEDVLAGIFFGILLVMSLYNFFLFFTVKDKSYLYYVIYVLIIALTQASVLGYTARFLFPENPFLINQALTVFVALAGISLVLFAASLLPVKKYIPHWNMIMVLLILPGIIAIPVSLAGYESISSKMADSIALLLSPVLLFIPAYLSYKKVRSAHFFLAGWIVALLGFMAYGARNFDLLPYSLFANNTMQVGIVIETVIFSLALADRINILKKENEEKQNKIILHLQENEKYILAAKEAELLVERLKKESLISQFESLKNQVNPHFLFNSLNVLTELIYQNQQMAAKFVKELSDVYRYVLDSKDKEVTDLHSELKFVEAFIYLLKIRYSNSLIVKNELKGSNATLPPLAIQLLLENSIKHNIISEKQPLTIELFREGDYVVVKNNLNKKMSTLQPSGIGISNLESRYDFLTEKRVIILNDGKYFTVKIPVLSFSLTNDL